MTPRMRLRGMRLRGMRLWIGPTLAAVSMLLASGADAHADDSGITVNGSGEAKAKPTSVELSATVAAEAELTADAVVKFNDARKKSLTALQALKMSNLTVEPTGMAISAAVDPAAASRGMGGGGGSPAAQKTRVAEDIRIVITGVDAMKPQDVTDAVMKLIDTGRDAGLVVGPKTPTNYYEFQSMAQNPGGYAIAQFRLDDATAARDQAMKMAMADARQHAEKLAALAGVTLGPVVSVHEGAADSGSTTNMRQMMYAMATGNTPATPTATTGKLEDVSVKASVTVQYQIAK